MKPPLAIAPALLGLVSASSFTELQTAYITAPGTNVLHPNGPQPADFYACKNFVLDNNIFDVKEITLDPSPPKKGTDGAYIKATITKGILKHTLDFDFCKGIVAGCPAPAGDVEFWTGQYISKLVPAGKAKIQLRAYTVDGRNMGCVEVPITLVKA